MAEERVYLGVKANSKVDEDRLVSELEVRLRSRAKGVRIERSKGYDNAPDADTLLLAVFAAPEALVLAEGIVEWMRNRAVHVTISGDDDKSIEGSADRFARVLQEVLTKPS